MLLSVSRFGINKFNLAAPGANESFQNCELTILELAERINQGYSFTCQLKGKRCSDNFIAAQFVAQDFDHWSLEEAKRDPFIREYGSLLYTTPNHRKDGNGDRFRVVYELEEAIYEADEYQILIKSLLEKVPKADKSCSDIARIYFGSKGSNPEVIKS